MGCTGPLSAQYAIIMLVPTLVARAIMITNRTSPRTRPVGYGGVAAVVAFLNFPVMLRYGVQVFLCCRSLALFALRAGELVVGGGVCSVYALLVQLVVQ